MGMTLGRLDYLYTPSTDVAADLRYLVDVLGGEDVFAIEDGGIRVAMVRFGDAPAILLTDHLEGDRPIHVFAVDDLDAAGRKLGARGWAPERSGRAATGASDDVPDTGWTAHRDLRAHKTVRRRVVRQAARLRLVDARSSGLPERAVG